MQWPLDPTVTNESQIVNLTCFAMRSPADVAVFTWLKDKTTLNTAESLDSELVTSTYTLDGIQKMDEGNYSCTFLDVARGVIDWRNFSVIVQGTNLQ